MRPALLCLALLPLACSPNLPDLEDSFSAETRAQGFPDLVPLGPLLAEAEAPLPRVAADEGTSLEARAEALRQRAAWLRGLPL